MYSCTLAKDDTIESTVCPITWEKQLSQLTSGVSEWTCASRLSRFVGEDVLDDGLAFCSEKAGVSSRLDGL